VIAGEAYNISNVTLENCILTYQKGSTHPYYVGKLDLQPNIPTLVEAPFEVGDTLYVKEGGCQNISVC
jgi:hypothetical protein